VTDVLMLVIVAAFFALAGALVVACDRILGHDDTPGEAGGVLDAPATGDAGDASRDVRGVDR